MTRDLIPIIGLDFGSVFALQRGPMGAASLDQTSQLVGRGGAASLLLAFARGVPVFVRSSFMQARYSAAAFFKINSPRKIRW